MLLKNVGKRAIKRVKIEVSKDEMKKGWFISRGGNDMNLVKHWTVRKFSNEQAAQLRFGSVIEEKEAKKEESLEPQGSVRPKMWLIPRVH